MSPAPIRSAWHQLQEDQQKRLLRVSLSTKNWEPSKELKPEYIVELDVVVDDEDVVDAVVVAVVFVVVVVRRRRHLCYCCCC